MKYVMCIFSVLFLLSVPQHAYANNTWVQLEYLNPEDKDYEEIISLDAEIKSRLEYMLKTTSASELPKNFAIDYTKSKKIYIDTDIFSMATEDADEIKSALKKGDYVWLLELDIHQVTYRITISKGLPLDESKKDILTDEQIELIMEQENKWMIPAIEVMAEGVKVYEALLQEMLGSIQLETDAELMLCGGLPMLHYPVALIMNKQKAEFLIPLTHIEIEGTEEQIKSIKPENVKDEAIYLYSKIKEAVNVTKDREKDTVGGAAINLSYLNFSNEEVKNIAEEQTDVRVQCIVVSFVTILVCVGVGFIYKITLTNHHKMQQYLK